MSGHHTWIVSCNGDGCFALFGRNPVDGRLDTVRTFAGEVGWSYVFTTECTGAEGTCGRMVDYCPQCTTKNEEAENAKVIEIKNHSA